MIIPYSINILLGFFVSIGLSRFYQYQTSIHYTFIGGCVILVLLLSFITFIYQLQCYKIHKSHEKQLSTLRHDIKGLLSPALLQADRIMLNKSADQKIIQSAEAIAVSIEKISAYLNSTKKIKN